MALLCYTAKFDPFLSLDCAPTSSTLEQSKERRGSNFAIWQLCTERPICSVPCDSIDDNCAKYTDEQGCKVSIGFLLPPVASLLILAIGGLIGWKIVISKRREHTAESSRPLPMDDMGNERKGEQEQYREVRVKEGFGVIMRDFVLYLTVAKDIKKQRELCKNVYDREAQILGGNVDLHYWFKLGTNAITSSFYDLVEGSISVTIKTFLLRFLPAAFFQIPPVIFVSISSLVKASLYYLDMCKDIMIATLIYHKGPFLNDIHIGRERGAQEEAGVREFV